MLGSVKTQLLLISQTCLLPGIPSQSIFAFFLPQSLSPHNLSSPGLGKEGTVQFNASSPLQGLIITSSIKVTSSSMLQFPYATLKYPPSWKDGPQEFLIIQTPSVSLYPTITTPWSEGPAGQVYVTALQNCIYIAANRGPLLIRLYLIVAGSSLNSSWSLILHILVFQSAHLSPQLLSAPI